MAGTGRQHRQQGRELSRKSQCYHGGGHYRGHLFKCFTESPNKITRKPKTQHDQNTQVRGQVYIKPWTTATETIRVKQGQTWSNRDNQGQTGSNQDNQHQTGSNRDMQGSNRVKKRQPWSNRFKHGQTRIVRVKRVKTGSNRDMQGTNGVKQGQIETDGVRSTVQMKRIQFNNNSLTHFSDIWFNAKKYQNILKKNNYE